MNKVLEIGAYVLASAVALGGGFVAADALFSSSEAAAGVEIPAPPPPNTAEIRNARYGFSFRYPQDWGQGPRYHQSVRESVGRRDGVFCYVSVMEKPVASDASGKPQDLRRHMAGLRSEHFERVFVPGAKTKVESLEKTTLGGQEARRFVIDVKAGAGAALRRGKLIGYATLRHFGAVFLVCVAPEGLHEDAGVRKDFATAFATFAFTGR
ncbi:MAG: hypothetical protein JNM29_12540 [Candidatus Odyssella sp.]|nr:hypothetical protein [Candidatus Odyssella sp.]